VEGGGVTVTIDEANAWRLDTPGAAGWVRTPRRDDTAKYFMVSADCHANEPGDWLGARIESEYRDRIPHVEVDDDGEAWMVTEGWRRQRLRTNMARDTMAAEDLERSGAGADPVQRLRDHDRDGVDVEVVFPNKGLLNWATPDPRFAMAMCRAWNRWAHETYADHAARILPMANVAPGDRDGTLAEIAWAADHGFRGLTLPCKPYWGAHDPDAPNYNHPDFDWLWAAVCHVGLPVTFHVSTGRDPRAARGNGGAVVNYVSHSLAPTMEPMANLCASGVLERFPDLRFATIEAGIGWVPWALDAMDEAYRKHHMWAFPKLSMLPSDHYRRAGFSSFQEDRAGLALAAEHDLVDNFLWANDYPHHEGSWPHSAEAIERQMGHLDDGARASILGLNAARLFGLDVPAREAS
jgi:predicted TIM-barrel fold metal-dependent hydrolase